jgi:two-component system chemotaxis response regulator CheY
LHGLGFETTEASNGAHGLATLAQGEPPDVVFVDWNMPEMTGIEFVRHARKEPRYTPTRIVMITSENEVSYVSEALEAGANEYLMKPFTQEGLIEKMAMLGLA